MLFVLEESFLCERMSPFPIHSVGHERRSSMSSSRFQQEEGHELQVSSILGAPGSLSALEINLLISPSNLGVNPLISPTK